MLSADVAMRGSHGAALTLPLTLALTLALTLTLTLTLTLALTWSRSRKGAISTSSRGFESAPG